VTILRHRGAVRAAAVVAASVALTFRGAAATAQVDPGATCERFGPGEVAGTVEDAALVEISGIAASGVHDDVWWVHNDSGGDPSVSAVSATGANLGRYTVEGASATDWEDVAVGPGPEDDRSYLYVGDIGDNAAARPAVTVYRVPEPSAAPRGDDGALAGAVALSLRYPGGPADAEALVVDPRDGDLLVVTKGFEGRSLVLRSSRDALAEGGEVVLEEAGSFRPGGSGPVQLVTGAAVSPDGAVVLVRTYAGVLAFSRPEGAPLATAFAAPPCPAPARPEPQGEAIGIAADGASYVTVSEGRNVPLHRFAVRPALAPPPSTTAPPRREPGAGGEGDGGGVSRVVVVAGGAVAVGLAVVAVGVVMAARRRRR
jgi:hypothetical protein